MAEQGQQSILIGRGDEPCELLLKRANRHGLVAGATGTGKSATTAWMVEELQRPTLVIAPNKTLAAQLANEFRELLPNNAVADAEGKE